MALPRGCRDLFWSVTSPYSREACMALTLTMALPRCCLSSRRCCCACRVSRATPEPSLNPAPNPNPNPA
eukprot:scaffold53278_cov36-Phaeocystis_antarctica.AAC.1